MTEQVKNGVLTISSGAMVIVEDQKTGTQKTAMLVKPIRITLSMEDEMAEGVELMFLDEDVKSEK